MSAGGLLGKVWNFLIIGGISMICGKIIDILTTTINSPNVLYGFPQDALNTISNLKLGYIAIPFLYLIYLLINHLIISNNESNRVV